MIERSVGSYIPIGIYYFKIVGPASVSEPYVAADRRDGRPVRLLPIGRLLAVYLDFHSRLRVAVRISAEAHNRVEDFGHRVYEPRRAPHNLHQSVV